MRTVVLISSFYGEDVNDARPSNHSHRWISLARLGESVPVAVGSSSSRKVEALEGDNWRDLDDYPFAETYFYLYSTVTFNNDLYLFGKMSDKNPKVVAMLKKA